MRYTFRFLDDKRNEVTVTQTTGRLWWKRIRVAHLVDDNAGRYTGAWVYLPSKDRARKALCDLIDKARAKEEEAEWVRRNWVAPPKPGKLPVARLLK